MSSTEGIEGSEVLAASMREKVLFDPAEVAAESVKRESDLVENR